MFTALDKELYPDDCDVVEIPHHNLYLYRMFKNGSSTLRFIAEKNHYRVFKKQEIGQLNTVDVLVRPPRPRYVAGICMFVQTIIRDNPSLDIDTAIWFANRYSFLNRHYLTQFHWLINLARWLDPATKIRFHDWSLLGSITDHDDKIHRVPVDPSWPPKIEACLSEKESWFLLDDILLGLEDQSLTWQQILQIYRKHPHDPLKSFTTAQIVCDVLR